MERPLNANVNRINICAYETDGSTVNAEYHTEKNNNNETTAQ